MDEEKSYNKGLSFYGTFAIIYAVLNIAAFCIMLLTTEWSVLAQDGGDVFLVEFGKMVFGIAAALIHGIAPAIVFKRSGNVKLLYIFPLAVMLVGFVTYTIGLFLIVLLVIPLGFPLFNCFSYDSAIYDNGIGDSVWFMSVIPAVIYALVIFVTTLSCKGGNKAEENNKHEQKMNIPKNAVKVYKDTAWVWGGIIFLAVMLASWAWFWFAYTHEIWGYVWLEVVAVGLLLTINYAIVKKNIVVSPDYLRIEHAQRRTKDYEWEDLGTISNAKRIFKLDEIKADHVAYRSNGGS